MNRSNTTYKSSFGLLSKGLAIALVLIAALGSTGCDDASYGGWDYGYYGYGPIDDDVFQSACDAWDDYIRM